MGLTYAGAPPCSGPDRAPTADDSAAPQSAPVDAVTRAVNVDALSPCSAVQIQYVSIAPTALGSASPLHCRRNRSAAVLPLRRHRSRSSRSPVRDARRPGDDPHHLGREPPEVVSRLPVGDLVQLPQLPVACESCCFGLEVGGSVARQAGRIVRLGFGHHRVEVVVDQQAPDPLVRVVTDELLDVDAAVPKHAPSRSGSAISVSTATTPSSPGLKSSTIAPRTLPGPGFADAWVESPSPWRTASP